MPSSKTDKIIDRLNSIDRTLAAQHVSLKDHMRRTEILEKAISPHRVLLIIASIAGILEAIHRMLSH